MKNAVPFLLLAALAGCAPRNVPFDPALAGPAPANPKAVMAAYVRQSFFDPYTVRDASISAPFSGHMYEAQGWVVCLRVNAKNRMGGYTGMSSTAYLIRNNVVIDTDPGAAICATQSYTPFPEIEDLQSKR